MTEEVRQGLVFMFYGVGLRSDRDAVVRAAVAAADRTGGCGASGKLLIYSSDARQAAVADACGAMNLTELAPGR